MTTPIIDGIANEQLTARLNNQQGPYGIYYSNSIVSNRPNIIICTQEDIQNEENAIAKLNQIGRYTLLDQWIMRLWNTTPQAKLRHIVFSEIRLRCSNEQLIRTFGCYTQAERHLNKTHGSKNLLLTHLYASFNLAFKLYIQPRIFQVVNSNILKLLNHIASTHCPARVLVVIHQIIRFIPVDTKINGLYFQLVSKVVGITPNLVQKYVAFIFNSLPITQFFMAPAYQKIHFVAHKTVNHLNWRLKQGHEFVTIALNILFPFQYVNTRVFCAIYPIFADLIQSSDIAMSNLTCNYLHFKQSLGIFNGDPGVRIEEKDDNALVAPTYVLERRWIPLSNDR
jgi:hypothetical protein